MPHAPHGSTCGHGVRHPTRHHLGGISFPSAVAATDRLFPCGDALRGPQVRELVQKMRPGLRQEPQTARDLPPSAREGPATTAAKAAKELETMISAQAPPAAPPASPWGGAGGEGQHHPAEVKAMFLNEGGVLVMMEVLDADNQKVRLQPTPRAAPRHAWLSPLLANTHHALPAVHPATML